MNDSGERVGAACNGVLVDIAEVSANSVCLSIEAVAILSTKD